MGRAKKSTGRAGPGRNFSARGSMADHGGDSTWDQLKNCSVSWCRLLLLVEVMMTAERHWTWLASTVCFLFNDRLRPLVSHHSQWSVIIAHYNLTPVKRDWT